VSYPPPTVAKIPAVRPPSDLELRAARERGGPPGASPWPRPDPPGDAAGLARWRVSGRLARAAAGSGRDAAALQAGVVRGGLPAPAARLRSATLLAGVVRGSIARAGGRGSGGDAAGWHGSGRLTCAGGRLRSATLLAGVVRGGLPAPAAGSGRRRCGLAWFGEACLRRRPAQVGDAAGWRGSGRFACAGAGFRWATLRAGVVRGASPARVAGPARSYGRCGLRGPRQPDGRRQAVSRTWKVSASRPSGRPPAAAAAASRSRRKSASLSICPVWLSCARSAATLRSNVPVTST
jgi:hypothetical protein